jgi:diphthine-ammonia ligase
MFEDNFPRKMTEKNTLCSWSGGKDSCYALIKAVENGLKPAVLLNVLNEEGKISRSHGIPASVLEEQAAKCGIPISLLPASWKDYETKFTAALKRLKQHYELTHAVFGDIDLDAHREWEEKVCAAAGLEAVLPLWKKDRLALFNEMMDAGIIAMIVSCNDKMGETFLGRVLSREIIPELWALGVDVCGENGEFHTLVLDCPLFSSPLNVNQGAKRCHQDYHFLTIELA